MQILVESFVMNTHIEPLEEEIASDSSGVTIIALAAILGFTYTCISNIALRNELKKLKGEARKKERDIRVLEQTKRELSEEVNTVRVKNREATDIAEELQRECDELGKKTREATDTAEELQRECDELRMKNREVIDSAERVVRECDELRTKEDLWKQVAVRSVLTLSMKKDASQ